MSQPFLPQGVQSLDCVEGAMALEEGQGCTELQSFCSECALSPRAEASSVRLFGAGGFPVRLFGQCLSCSSEFVAVQVGVITARPLSNVYDPNAELRRYWVHLVGR